jgi:hypothetical protein
VAAACINAGMSVSSTHGSPQHSSAQASCPKTMLLSLFVLLPSLAVALPCGTLQRRWTTRTSRVGPLLARGFAARVDEGLRRGWPSGLAARPTPFASVVVKVLKK